MNIKEHESVLYMSTDSKGLKGNLTIPYCTAIPFYREFKKLVVLNAER